MNTIICLAPFFISKIVHDYEISFFVNVIDWQYSMVDELIGLIYLAKICKSFKMQFTS